ncbi:MAG: hypothetical protein LH480_06360 [Rubrivivax sp.]|nr:hypothetical protein [Rubrivivax sp.]
MPDDPPWSTVQMAAAMVAHRRIELLHAHLPKAHLLAALAGGLTRRPVLATVHGQHLTALDLELHHTARSHLSEVCRQSCFHALGMGVDPALLSWEANGIDTERFRPDLAQWPAAAPGCTPRWASQPECRWSVSSAACRAKKGPRCLCAR